MENMTLQELIQTLIQMEKQYPNNYDLGLYMRQLIDNKLKPKSK